MDILKLEDLDIYQLAVDIGESVWNIVDKWDWFVKKTVGAQFVTAADSISANIAEGYGRYFYKDRKQFYYYSRGSVLETKNRVTKSKNRSLITQDEYDLLIEKLQILHH
ncbi:MAG TPA: four helix bundle protein, partial [Segetibacter sp.]